MNPNIKESLIQSGMEIARETAEKYVSSEADFEELFSEAVIALYDTVCDFNSFEDEQFNLLLTRRIEERIRKFYSSLTWFLPIDPRIVQLHDRYKIALLELYPECNNPEDKTVQDEQYVAEYLGISVKELRAMKSEYAMCRIQSLDEIVTDDLGDKVRLIETIVDPKTDTV